MTETGQGDVLSAQAEPGPPAAERIVLIYQGPPAALNEFAAQMALTMFEPNSQGVELIGMGVDDEYLAERDREADR